MAKVGYLFPRSYGAWRKGSTAVNAYYLIGEWDAISGCRFRSTQIENSNRRPGSAEPGIRGKFFMKTVYPPAIRVAQIAHSLLRRVQYVSTTGKTNPCTRSNTQKNISNFLMHRIRQNYGRTRRTRHQAGPWCTQLQILLSVCQISKFQNFHNFLGSHQPKGCFLSDRQKKSRILPIKK